MGLKQIVEGTDTRAGRIFDLCVQAVIAVAITEFAIDTLPNLPSGLRDWFPRVELVLVLLFSTEYVLRVAVATKKQIISSASSGSLTCLRSPPISSPSEPI